MPPSSGRKAPEVLVVRRSPVTSAAYDALWRFAAERQRIFMLRAAGRPGPWTTDAILLEYKFTNAYRASDRVSQYLLRRVIYPAGKSTEADLVARVLLFKFFNRIDTWETLVRRSGGPSASAINNGSLGRILDEEVANDRRIFSAAYIMPGGSGPHIGPRKHQSYLSLLRAMLQDGLPAKVGSARSLRDLYETLLAYPMMGPFLAFQYAIDLNYTPLTDFKEDSFVVAGPGALDGLHKCFTDPGDYDAPGLIKWVAERQAEEFRKRDLAFETLGDRPLQLIDVQNLFCEVSKYTRVSHPHITGVSGRTRIKQKFAPAGSVSAPFYPPKWDVNDAVKLRLAEIADADEPRLALRHVPRPSQSTGLAAAGA